jgi:hypothetical protein
MDPVESEQGAGTDRSRIDISDLPAEGVAEFVRTNVDTDRVSLEHRGAHTYLVVEK